jgi:hypothetical protein
MQFHLPPLRTLLGTIRLDARRVLSVSWWVLTAAALGLLIVDGAVFYRYGLSRADGQEIPIPRVDLKSQETTIRTAAAILLERRAAYEGGGAGQDAPNPFR